VTTFTLTECIKNVRKESHLIAEEIDESEGFNSSEIAPFPPPKKNPRFLPSNIALYGRDIVSNF